MLLEVGTLALAQGMPEQAARLRALLDEQEPAGDPWLRARCESEVFGCTVPQASAYLLGLWGFAPAVVHMVASQPMDSSQAGATRADLLVGFAHRLVLDPGAAVSSPGHSLLDDDTLHTWTAISQPVMSLR
jgi:hypothetical protein